MTAADEQLLDEYTRIKRRKKSIALQVGRVGWDGPYDPYIRWHTWRAFASEPTPEQIAAVRAELLEDRRYFGLCTRCAHQYNAGHMHDDATCQGCAERYLGVVSSAAVQVLI